MKELLKTLLAGFQLSVFRAPRAIKALRPSLHFWLLIPFGILLSLLQQWLQLLNYPYQISHYGLLSDCLAALLLLFAFTALFNLYKKPVWIYSAAALALAAQLPMLFCWLTFEYLAAHFGQVHLFRLASPWLFSAWWWLVLWRLLHFLQIDRMAARAAVASLAVVCATYWPYFGPLSLNMPRYVEVDQRGLYSEEQTVAEPAVSFDPEAVMYAQRSMLERELNTLAPQTPGVIDLYVIALAGDGSEDTFLNEVRYSKQLFSQRFGARKRVLILANHATTTAEFPLANGTNLRAAIKGVAQRMDTQEDLLLLFVTSHGSETHELAVDLYPLAMNPIRPATIADALARANITRHVSIVSACYSGGFIDALKSETSVVMTAARADRTSFGCGGDFDMTYFGRAYLQEALNQTTDLLKAFELAERAIRKRERKNDFEASEPQIHIGAKALDDLNRWKRELTPGEPVPFFGKKRQ